MFIYNFFTKKYESKISLINNNQPDYIVNVLLYI